ncbi:MAG TPA: hypothetical protein VM096_00515 [Vicinamibacterales bacterium]|nr:hypothetical protein [Vicinamibacterales bacterium]
MTARLKKTVVRRTAGVTLLALLAVISACTSYTEIPIETPIQPKLDVSAFQRVFIAGFIAGANEDVDANMETVRLLRSQLRNKGIMRVIDADTLPLLEIAKQNGGEATAPPVPDQQAVTPAQDQDKPPVFNDEKDLEPYNHIFANVAYWKKIGEEYQQPLIVTGAVLFAPQQRSGFVQREQETYDPFGRRVVVPVRTYMERKGFVLRPTFIFIDGRTGETLHTETFREEILYNASQQTPALSSYFELMDRLLPAFLNTLSAQKIKGTRTLLK